MNDEKVIMTEDKAKKILMWVGVSAAVVAGIVIGAKVADSHKIKIGAILKSAPKLTNKIVDLDVPKDFNVGTVMSLWEETTFVNAILDNVKIEDMGRLGEQFLKVDGITNESPVSMIVGFRIK
jgi:hypothetical protein